jgi:hypothetical protein
MSAFSTSIMMQQAQPIDVIPVVVVVESNGNGNEKKSRRSSRHSQGCSQGKTTNTAPRRRQTISFGELSLAGACLVILVFALSCIRIDNSRNTLHPRDLFRMAPANYNDSTAPLSSSSSSIDQQPHHGVSTRKNKDSSILPPARLPDDGLRKLPKRSVNMGPLMKGGYVEVTFTDPWGGCRIAKVPRDRKFLKVDAKGPKLSINDIMKDGGKTVPTKMALPKNLESFPCPPASAKSY